MTNKTDELVLGIRREHLEALAGDRLWDGYRPSEPAGLLNLDAILAHCNFMPRSKAEKNPGFKQLIPYIVPVWAEYGRAMVGVYVRGEAGGEDRLHARRSIGIGGHINRDDFVKQEVTMGGYMVALLREANEELKGDWDYNHVSEAYGFINDDNNEVGRVHLGVVHQLYLPKPHLDPREKGLLDIAFTDRIFLRELANFEGWSQILIEADLWFTR